MRITAYPFSPNDDKVTTYIVEVNEKVLLLDCGSQYLNTQIVANVDYIFISHAHLDHWDGLFLIYQSLKQDCRIFATTTTKKIIQEIVNDRLQSEEGQKYDKKKVRKRVDAIEPVFFENTMELLGLYVTFYPAGHMYGAAMMLLETKDGNLLYTGDMDYVPYQEKRSYHYTSRSTIDYVIVDGTKLYHDSFKKEWISNVAKYIKTGDRSTHYLLIKDKSKAIFLAFALADSKKITDYTICYAGDLLKINTILHEQGYEVYRNGKIMQDTYDDRIKKKIVITTKPVNELKIASNDYKLGLHISAEDLQKFIMEHASNAQVYVGHYGTDQTKNLIKNFPQYQFLEANKIVECKKVKSYEKVYSKD